MKDFEIDNLEYVIITYGEEIASGELLLGIDKLNCGNGADLVLYSPNDMLQEPEDIKDFYSIIEENGLDEEAFEVGRYTLIKIDDELNQ